MSAAETAGRYETLVYWRRTGTGPDGRPTFAAPTVVLGRVVQNKNDAQGSVSREVGVRARIIVNVDVPVGSSFWSGTLTEWNNTGVNDPTAVVWEVVGFDVVPDVRYRSTLRRANVIRKGSKP